MGGKSSLTMWTVVGASMFDAHLLHDSSCTNPWHFTGYFLYWYVSVLHTTNCFTCSMSVQCLHSSCDAGLWQLLVRKPAAAAVVARAPCAVVAASSRPINVPFLRPVAKRDQSCACIVGHLNKQIRKLWENPEKQNQLRNGLKPPKFGADIDESTSSESGL